MLTANPAGNTTTTQRTWARMFLILALAGVVPNHARAETRSNCESGRSLCADNSKGGDVLL